MQSWFFNLQQPSLNRRDNKKKSLTTLGNIRIIPVIVTATVIIAILGSMEQQQQQQQQPIQQHEVTAVGSGDSSRLVGVPVAAAAGGDVMAEREGAGGVSNLQVGGEQQLKRKRGRPAKNAPRPAAAPPPVRQQQKVEEEEEEDVCFICFDGGSLVLCDRRWEWRCQIPNKKCWFNNHSQIDLCSKKAKEFVPLTNSEAIIATEFASTANPLVAIIHYATLRWIPSQSPGEIRRIFDVIQYLAPCNFLIFGIGHDSMIWDTINPGGNTVFIEENPKWTLSALKRFPILRIHTVRYPTRQSQADTLLSSYKKHCSPGHTLKQSRKCPLALSQLPEEIYERDWDVIFIDAPRRTSSSAAGRMAVIYSAAIMARWRKRSGVTHVFLHDADRKIEQQYAQEFLCMKYRVGGVRRLWHFVIPPAFNGSDSANDGFC